MMDEAVHEVLERVAIMLEQEEATGWMWFFALERALLEVAGRRDVGLSELRQAVESGGVVDMKPEWRK